MSVVDDQYQGLTQGCVNQQRGKGGRDLARVELPGQLAVAGDEKEVIENNGMC
ncbi:MAG TPA: hypothetical protein VMU94_00660 [Streptosporangiaceae bacterium]|nr:hypothetical protein [Streptosporangiaceae bacterium]